MRKINLLDRNSVNLGINITDENQEVAYAFTTDVKEFDKLIEWLYSNTTGRFTFLGTSTIYFEEDEDALLFKLTWYGEEQ